MHYQAGRPACKASATGTPRVAVIVPAYGVAHLLHEALDSLQSQTLEHWECVVVDDGAPDDVAGAVAPFLADPRITLLQTDNGGVSTARNRAIAATSAPYIALLDGDDLFRPDYLEKMTAALEADPQARLVTCNARIFGAVAKERHCFTGKQGSGDGLRGTLRDVIDRSFGVYIGSTFRRADHAAVGGFDSTMTHVEDFDFWVRLLLLGGHARYLDAVLADYRVRGNSASAAAERMIKGGIRTYEKALEQLPTDSPAAVAARDMIEVNRRKLRFEMAIDRAIDGDRSAVDELRRDYADELGAIWQLSFLLWRFAPQLAAPMLTRRRKANARGAGVRETDTPTVEKTA